MLKGDMDLRKLRYFLEVADAGSITAAAERLRMTQPALSRQVRAFEDEMGWPLLDRGAKSIQLTKQGKVVLREGKAILAAVEGGVERMRREIEGGVIRIGYAPSLGGEILKNAMGCFVQRHSGVKLELHDETTEEMRRKVLSGELDLMIGVRAHKADMEWVDLDSKKLVLAVPQGHALADKSRIKPGDLEGVRLLLLSRHDYPEYWSQVIHFFKDQGVNAKVAGEFDGIESLGVALRAGVGVALVAERASVGEGVHLIHMQPEPDPVSVAVGWRADRALDAMTSAFVEELSLNAQDAKSPGQTR
ncbi:HTH-type transcriptional regulator CynR [Rubritalea halochordaticola]|uniref:HTH-type transcriptional regulator CynR n=2 Tax=Rubritalea halochordaticola TaxID=714537 RepID=A0ABP9V360_9BACT